MNKPIKRDAGHIYNTLSASLPMGGIFSEFSHFVTAIIEEIRKFNFSDDLAQDVRNFLKIEISSSEHISTMIEGSVENIGYTVLLSHIGVSREQMKNIVFNYHPSFNSFQEKATPKRVLEHEEMFEALVHLLISGFDDQKLHDILGGDLITLNRFDLSRTGKLSNIFLDMNMSRRLIEDTYKSRVQNKKGFSTETAILAGILKKRGVSYQSGSLPQLEKYFSRTSSSGDILARNPRIDLIIPSIENPIILVESTYNQTTASGQTKKIDANDSVFRAISLLKKDLGRDLIFVNFVDGAGWKSRGISDVSRLVSSCDYAINFNNLDLFDDIIMYYLLKS
jgi:hypothetical protein